MSRAYVVRRLKIGRTEQMDALARTAGELYSQVVLWFWRTVRHKDLWLKAKHLMRWLTSALLHAHSSDAVVQSFFTALASWHARRKDDPEAKPPYKRKRFYPVQWKATAIRVKDDMLHLANGRGNAPLIVPWCWSVPCQVEHVGMKVVLVDERYTTRTCPACGRRYKPNGRMYRCRNPLCRFVFHRDGVGAVNIRQKYTASGPVVGAMASPTGVRYQAHLPRSTAFP